MAGTFGALRLPPAPLTGSGLPRFLPGEIETCQQAEVHIYGPPAWTVPFKSAAGRARVTTHRLLWVADAAGGPSAAIHLGELVGSPAGEGGWMKTAKLAVSFRPPPPPPPAGLDRLVELGFGAAAVAVGETVILLTSPLLFY